MEKTKQKNFLFSAINTQGKNVDFFFLGFPTISKSVIWFMQSELLYFSQQRSSSLLVVGKPNLFISFWEGTNLETVEVCCCSFSHRSSCHQTGKPSNVLRSFAGLTVLHWWRRLGKIPQLVRQREDWVGPECPIGITILFLGSSPHSCHILIHEGGALSYLFNKYWLNINHGLVTHSTRGGKLCIVPSENL